MFSGALGVVIFIMCLIAPVVIITLIIIATTRKNKDSNPKKFEETIRAIYIYSANCAICYNSTWSNLSI